MMTNAANPHETTDTLDQILRDLDRAEGDLPTEAIRAAQHHRAQIVPLLIRAIRDASARAAAGDVPPGNAHFHALFLLTEFRSTEALPAIVEAISLPGELPFDLFGDAITEILHNTLATLAGDRIELLDDLIGNRSLNEYVRIGAANAFQYLVRDGRMTRDAAVASLRRHLQQAIADNDRWVASALVWALLDYGATEARDDIQAAFQSDLIDEFMIDEAHAEECIARGEAEFHERLDALGPTGIDDTVAELSSWFAYRETRGSEARPDEDQEDWPDFISREARARTPTTIRNEHALVGRNDPCPCGSGKKFKKCCGARVAAAKRPNANIIDDATMFCVPLINRQFSLPRCIRYGLRAAACKYSSKFVYPSPLASRL